MNPRRIHVLYEYGPDSYPHGSAFIRLLRPLTHPSLSASLEVSYGWDYKGQAVDAVIVDRLWRPDVSPALVQNLVERTRRAGARLIYALDDNLLDLPPENLPFAGLKHACSAEEQHWVIRFFLQEADGVLVTTQALAQRLLDLNENITVVPHALDEQLLVSRWIHSGRLPFGPRRKIVGYMGTLTHDDDLMMVLPALRTVCESHGEEVEFQIVGGIGYEDTWEALDELPVRIVNPRPEESAYPLFMLWFTSRLRWDVAISPLMDTPFNRCKSDIKFLDYSAMGAAGIYSRVPAYESTVHDGQTGLLVDNNAGAWVEALEALLADDGLRMRLARNAVEYLYTQRILGCRAQAWPAALDKLLEDA